MTQPQKNAKKAYRKKVKSFTFEMYPTEQDIIDRLFGQENKAGYVKNLIRNDIKKSRE